MAEARRRALLDGDSSACSRSRRQTGDRRAGALGVCGVALVTLVEVGKVVLAPRDAVAGDGVGHWGSSLWTAGESASRGRDVRLDPDCVQ